MAEEFEVKSEEIVDRVRTSWVMEIPQDAPLSEADEEASGTAKDEDVHWMGIGTNFDERDRAVSTLAYHERQTPGRQRLVRFETRCLVEYVTPEELQKWHDIAAKGDAEKKAHGG